MKQEYPYYVVMYCSFAVGCDGIDIHPVESLDGFTPGSYPEWLTPDLRCWAHEHAGSYGYYAKEDDSDFIVDEGDDCGCDPEECDCYRNGYDLEYWAEPYEPEKHDQLKPGGGVWVENYVPGKSV